MSSNTCSCVYDCQVSRENYILLEMVKLFVAAVLLAMSYGCGDAGHFNPMDEDLYQGFRFEYDEESNETNVGAVFRLGSKDGEKVNLSPPAFLLVNEDICVDYDETREYPYNVTFESRLPEAVIDFQDFHEQMFAHNIKLDSLVNVGELLISSKRDNETVAISFTGEEMCPGETITLVVTYDNEEFRYDVNPGDDNTITLKSDIVTLFSGKEVGIKILRIKNIELDNVSPAGGDLRLVYTSRERRVQL